MTECTLREESAKRYRSPSRKSAILVPSPTGTTAQPALARPKVMTGEIMKIAAFALLGTIDSLTNSLSPSARGCRKP
jgi:hypothetical protein